MNKFKNGLIFLCVPLLMSCSNSEKVMDLSYRLSKASLKMGYECAEKKIELEECLKKLDMLFQSARNKNK